MEIELERLWSETLDVFQSKELDWSSVVAELCEKLERETDGCTYKYNWENIWPG
jgi:hypothetical protein